jgi:hypothetical protein
MLRADDWLRQGVADRRLHSAATVVQGLCDSLIAMVIVTVVYWYHDGNSAI